MIIRIIAVGTRMPAWVDAGFQEYAKRMISGTTLELYEIPAEKRSKNADILRLTDKEGEKILDVIKPANRIIALDVKGQGWSTEQLSGHLKTWQHDGRNVDLLIGGPDGLAKACLAKAELKWSLSPLTLPHPLVRILLAEQLYRASSILLNHPYHR